MRHRISKDRDILADCIKALGYEKGTDTELAKLIIEREEAISQLRRICEAHGDNDWDENLHMGDIIEKHLGNYLGDCLPN